MTQVPLLTTPRLRLRPARPSDAICWDALLASPEMCRWMLPPKPWTPGAVWSIATEDTVIGRAAVSPDGDLDYWLGSAHWGQGLTTEAVGALTAWALDAMGVDQLQAVAHRDNRRSHRVLEKLAFRFVGLRRLVMPGAHLPWPVCQFAKARGARRDASRRDSTAPHHFADTDQGVLRVPDAPTQRNCCN